MRRTRGDIGRRRRLAVAERGRDVLFGLCAAERFADEPDEDETVEPDFFVAGRFAVDSSALECCPFAPTGGAAV
jgi:hypothetical protein